jgi:hypothetical protein
VTWFDRHAFASVTTDDFVAFLRTELVANQPSAISDAELTDWIDGDGVPATAVEATSKRLAAIDAARAAWLAGGAIPSAPSAKWTTLELVHLLEGMPAKLTRDQLVALDKQFAFTGTRNGEIAERWYPLTIRSGYTDTRPAIAAFVGKIGRRKLIMPIYRALAATPSGLAFANQTFARAKPHYHPIAASSIQAMLTEAGRKKP